MNQTFDALGSISHILSEPGNGIEGIVDNLVCLCQAHHLQLDFEPPRYCVRFLSGARQELGDLKIRTSVFRAILARIAALCNVDFPGSVPLYGGSGSFSPSADNLGRCLVRFTNTASEQKLELEVRANSSINQAPVGNGSPLPAMPSDASTAG